MEMTIHSALFLGTLVALIEPLVASGDKSKNQFDYDLVCKGGMQVVLNEFYGSVTCFADAFGIKYADAQGKYPPRMSKCIPPSMVKSKALSSPKRFKKWLCSRDRPDRDFDGINDCIANITDVEDQMMHDCHVELAGGSIRDQVCVLKNQRELAWQFEEYRCLQQSHQANFTCWTSTFGEQSLFSDKKQFNNWLCADENTPVELVHAYEVCTFAIPVDQDKMFFKCLGEAAKKFI